MMYQLIIVIITMKKLTYCFAVLLVLLFAGYNLNGQGKTKTKKSAQTVIQQDKQPDNTLTDNEVKNGWKLLFDGYTSAGWMNAKSKTFPSTGWEIKDGMLKVTPENGAGGDLVTIDKYRNFELTVDFKYTKGANSGIKYFVDTEVNNGEFASIGCEYQILDDKNNPDAKAGIAGNHTLASLYDLIAPVNIKDNGTDNWNRAIIIVKKSHVEHWLNGQKTVEYERGTKAWKDLVATSKFKTFPGFGEIAEGRILLQEHGGAVSFKNIKIRKIGD
jgi:hypothetical protein